MIVSWNWLKQYVPLDMPLEELERRLMMSGLNHEGTEEVAGDLAIDLEVTSNRPDCLGHIGVAREVAVHGIFQCRMESIRVFASILIFRPKREFLIPRSGPVGSNGEKLDPLSSSILS